MPFKPCFRRIANWVITLSGLSNCDIANIPFPPQNPPWSLQDFSPGQLTIIHHPEDAASRTSTPDIRKEKALLFLSTLPSVECLIWTDGSAVSGYTQGGSGAVVTLISENTSFLLKAPAGKYCSSTQAELSAIHLSLKHILSLPSIPNSIRLCSDSRAGLESLSKGPICQTQQIGLDIWHCLSSLLHHGSNLTLVWVPGHAGLTGNDLADSLAASASSLPQENLPISQVTANMAVYHSIQKLQLDSSPNHLLARPPDFHLLERWEQCIISQLRTNWSFLTSDTLFLFGKVDSPICTLCQLYNDSITHLLTSCPATYHARLKFFSSNYPPLSFIISQSARRVIAFLKEVGRI